MLRRPPWPFPISPLWAMLLLALICSGCGRGNVQPLPAVTTAVGTKSPCANCEKTIENVTEENLFTYKGVQYVVCDKKCAQAIREWIDMLDE